MTPEPRQARKRVLVTGSGGYIGSVMAPLLVRAGYDVVGLDTGYFEGCEIAPPADIPTVRADIRDVTVEDLDGFEAVIHLAALSNDPIGNLNDEWTADINERATVRLAEAARAAGVSRILFSSSCIMYGLASGGGSVDETSPLNPQTMYARSKVAAEAALAKLASDTFSPVYLRNGTVYGLSPRMRFDTVLNNLVGSAVVDKRVVVNSDGTPWRPVVHVEDVSRAFIHVLEAPRELVHDQAFNVGSDSLNHQVIELARYAVAAVPGAAIDVRSAADADQRTYRTDFGKFARTFPDFRFEWHAEAGARDLARRLEGLGLDRPLYDDPRYTRLRWLRGLLDGGRLDAQLRWSTSGEDHRTREAESAVPSAEAAR